MPKSAAASLSLKEQLLAQIPVETIRGFASLAASLGYLVSQHKQVKRSTAPIISYAALFRVFCGDAAPNVLSLRSDDATLTLLGRRLAASPDWMWLSELRGTGAADRQVVHPYMKPPKITLNIDGELQVVQPHTVFRGVAPKSGGQFMLIAEAKERISSSSYRNSLESVGLVYRESDEAEVVAFVRGLLQDANPFKNRVVLINRDLRTVRSRMSERTWNDVVPHERAREELDFIAASIRNRDMLRAEGLSIKRGLLLRGRPATASRPRSSASSTASPARRRSSLSKRSITSAPSTTSRSRSRHRSSSSRTST